MFCLVSEWLGGVLLSINSLFNEVFYFFKRLFIVNVGGRQVCPSKSILNYCLVNT